MKAHGMILDFSMAVEWELSVRMLSRSDTSTASLGKLGLWMIGLSVSIDCIRMLSRHVIQIYEVGSVRTAPVP